MEFNNLSDGKSDGIVLFYMKEGKLKPIGLCQEQAEALDLIIMIPFKEKSLKVINQNINVEDGVII